MAKIKSSFLYKQPKYYDNFQCIGGKCPRSCCAKWQILWDINEIDKLKNSNCSDEIKSKIDTTFKKVTDEKYAIVLDEHLNCPFLDDEKMCSIQKNVGAEYLSVVCNDYPRRCTLLNKTFIRNCSISCYAAVELVCAEENSMDIIMKEFKTLTVRAKNYSEKEYEKHPELNYLHNIFDFLYEILSDKTRDISTSIVLGALAAKKISDIVAQNKSANIADIINKLKPQINNKKQIDNIKNMDPNFSFSIGVIDELYKELYTADALKVMYTDGIPDVNKFVIGWSKFVKAYSDKNYILKNVILNYFIEIFTFNYKYDYSVYENYLYFAFIASIVKMSSAVMGYVGTNNNEIRTAFIEYQSVLARRLDSTKETMNEVISYFKEHNWTTPAYIALMII